MNQDKVREFIMQLCRYGEENEDFGEDFYRNLQEDEEIMEEFTYFMEHGSFACKAKVHGYTVVDVMVWQIDHFKAWLDRDTAGTRQNKDRMLLLSFDTFLKMRKNPEKYIQKMQGETGTDYQGKYE